MKNLIIVLLFLMPFSGFSQTSYVVKAGQSILYTYKDTTIERSYDTQRTLTSWDSLIVITVGDTIANVAVGVTVDSINTIVTNRTTGKELVIALAPEWSGVGTITLDDSTKIDRGAGVGADWQLIGTDTVTGTWTNHAGNIYKITYATGFNSLFLDGVTVPVSRFPNKDANGGYATITSTTSTSVFSSDTLSGIDWTGSGVIFRLRAWAYEAENVASFSDTTVTLSAAPSYVPYTVGTQFYMINNLATLDGANQWAWDDATNTLYLWTPNGDTPANYTVEVSSINNAIVIAGKSNITVKNGNFFGYEGDAVKITGAASNIEIDNSVFTNNYASAVNLYDANTSYVGINNNTITGSSGWGIKAQGSYHDFSNNAFSNIGLDENIGVDGLVGIDYGGIGILSYPSNNTTIANNTFNNIGFNGIHFYGLNTTIEKNRIDFTNQTLNDGGGIYTQYESTGSIIRKNIISNSGWLTKNWDYGIYMDATTNGVTIEDNTVFATNGVGIFLSTCKNMTVTGNTSFNNVNGAQLQIRHILAEYTMENNLIEDNILFTDNYINWCLQWYASDYVDSLAQINANVMATPEVSTVQYPYYYVKPPVYKSCTLTSFVDSTGVGVGGTLAKVSDYANAELFYNASNDTIQQVLTGTYRDLDSIVVASGFDIPPWKSQILVKD